MTLTASEKTFFERVAHHMAENGLASDIEGNLEAACKAIVARDEQLWLQAMNQNEEGEAIREAICSAVYNGCRRV